MKKCKKRIFALVMTFVLFLSLSIPNRASARIDFYATLQIVSLTGGGVLSSVGYNGHSFLIVQNDSNVSITVGHMNVAAGDSVTIGTFGNRGAHKGIWYNIEANAQPGDCYSSLVGLTQNSLSTMNSVINNNDEHSDLADNCSAFARDVWNSVSPNKVSGWNPAGLVNSIKTLPSYQANTSIPYKSISSIAYQTSTSVQYDPSGAANPGTY